MERSYRIVQNRDLTFTSYKAVYHAVVDTTIWVRVSETDWKTLEEAQQEVLINKNGGPIVVWGWDADRAFGEFSSELQGKHTFGWSDR